MAAAPDAPARDLSPRKSLWPSFVRFWSSIKLGIGLILAIAAASTLGTVIPQGDASVIQNLPTSESTKQILLALGANNVYYSGWFLTLLGLFFLNLWMATQVMVLPRLRVGLRKPPEVPVEAQRQLHDVTVPLPPQPLETIARALKNAGYRLYPSRRGGLIGHKGRWSRFAPLVTHIGLFTILIGGIWSGLTVFKAQVPMFPGEQVRMTEIVDGLAQPRGPLARRDRDWSVRLDRFWMEYYDANTVRQFYSNLSILKDGKVVETRKIWVNEPLVHDGVWFYQAFWGVGAIDTRIGQEARRIEMRPGDPLGLKGTLSQIVTIGRAKYICYLQGEREPLVILRFFGGGRRPEPVAVIAPGETRPVEGVAVTFRGPVLYSGLQVKADPGIPVVYTGFWVVMLGTALAFFGLRQVWVNPDGDGYLLSGKANRGRQAHRLELVKLTGSLGASFDE